MILLIVCPGLAGCRAPAGRKGPPNIVLIVADACRRDHLRIYGYDKDTTPFLSSWLRNGLVFRDFYSNSAYTIASHYALFSGNLPAGMTPRVEESFIPALKAMGYRTLGISANPMVGPDFDHTLGFDEFRADPGLAPEVSPEILDKKNRFDRMSGHVNPLSAWLRIHLSTTADLVNERVFLTLGDHFQKDPERPFFLFVNYMETHDPYFPHTVSPQGFNYNLRDENGLLYAFFRKAPGLSEPNLRALRNLYDNEIVFLDSQILGLWKYLESRGELESTIFVLTSDHGELLGEHGLFTHELGLYDEEVEIPFVIFGPGLERRDIRGLHSLQETGSIIKSLARRELSRIGKRGKPYVVHREYVLDAAEKEFLPVFCRTDLLRITFPTYAVYYYRHQDREQIVAQESGTGRAWRGPISRQNRKVIAREIEGFTETLGRRKPLGKDVEERLRSLGYIK